MRTPNIVRFSHFKIVYVESLKIICLHIISEMSVWLKTFQKISKIPFMNRLNTKAVAKLGTKKMMVPACTFNKRKEGGNDFRIIPFMWSVVKCVVK